MGQETMEPVETGQEATEPTAAEETTQETATGQEQAPEKEEPNPWAAIKESIKDEKLRKHAERFLSGEDAVKSSLELRQKLSKAIVKPGENATEEELATFRKALDVPETPDKYEFPIPEGIELSDTQKQSMDNWKEIFHANYISKGTSKVLLEALQADMAVEQEAMARANAEFVKESENALKEDWGNEYDKNHEYANRAAREGFDADFEDAKMIQTADGKFLLDHPVIVRMFAKFGREMNETGLGDVMDSGQKETILDQIEETIQKRDAAQAAGNTAEAKRWYNKEQELYAKLDGNKNIVGTEGRVS